MIAPLSPNAATRGFTPDSCIVDCNGAQIRAHCRDEVTVVQVTGDIDATNIDRFYDYTPPVRWGGTWPDPRPQWG
jgi:hypothetical protein